jgi:hypothetical protein
MGKKAVVQEFEVPSSVIGHKLDGRGFISGEGKRFCLLHSVSRQIMGPTQPPIQWVAGAFSPGVEQLGREADHSPSI